MFYPTGKTINFLPLARSLAHDAHNLHAVWKIELVCALLADDLQQARLVCCTAKSSCSALRGCIRVKVG